MKSLSQAIHLRLNSLKMLNLGRDIGSPSLPPPYFWNKAEILKTAKGTMFLRAPPPPPPIPQGLDPPLKRSES